MTQTEPETRQLWITPLELAQQLHVDEGSVRRYLRDGRLPAARKLPGNGWRLPADAARLLLTVPRSSSASVPEDAA